MMGGPVSDGTPWRRLILVVGHRRSGTTWLAAVLGRARGVHLIPKEPLWLTQHPPSPFVEDIHRWQGRFGWHIGWDEAEERDAQDAAHLREHLAWLCRHYHGGDVDTLVVKEPHPNWLPFLMQAFQPDRVIYVQRHAAGIVNSYDEHGLFVKWGVEEEWGRFRDELPHLLPGLAREADRARHPAERVAFMARAADELALRHLQDVPHRVVGYERACLEPRGTFADLYEWLGWEWDEAAWEAILPLVAPPGGVDGAGFVDVQKASERRAYGWRSELAAHLIRRLRRLSRELGWEWPFPGDGLPALSAAEMRAAYRRYISRRRAYLRQFGLRATLKCL